MPLDLFIQQLVNALSLGGIYALLALGLAVVFSIIRLINFAHGEIMTVGGYGVFFSLLLGWPIPAARMTSRLSLSALGTSKGSRWSRQRTMRAVRARSMR